MEVEPRDRRGAEPARRREGDAVAHPTRKRIALERAPEARRQREDRDDGGEGELEAGVEDVPRVPGEQHDRADEERIPAVPLPAGQPGERAERGGDAGPDDRRLRPDREHVRDDRKEPGRLGSEPRDAEEQGKPDGPAADDDDVAAADREQVVEPGRPEALPEPVREPSVLAEHDACQDRAPFSREPGCRGAREPRVQAVGDAAAEADDAPRGDAQHDVDAVAAEPGPLERGGRAHRDERAQLGSLRRRPRPGKLQEHGLVDRLAPPAADDRAHAHLPAASPRRLGHLHEHPPRRPGVGHEHAAVERLQALASPPPARDHERARECEPRLREREQHEHRCAGERGADRGRGGEPDHERTAEQIGAADQGTTSPFSCASRPAPMPGTASSSSTEWNAPCACR